MIFLMEAHLYCDAHVHLLPDIDNGPANPEVALTMLRTMQDNGTHRAVITPHFYHDRETVTAFLARRKEALHSFLAVAKPIQRFSFLLSAEVHISPGVSRLPLLDRLLIPHTRFLPVELPLGAFEDFAIRELSHLIHKRNIQPIICQCERHFILYSKPDYEKLISLPHTLYAFSTNALFNDDIVTKIVRLITSNHTVLLGSNAHNASDRPPADKAFEQEISKSRATVYKILCQETENTLNLAFT